MGQKTTGPRTWMQDKFLAELPKAKNPTDAARKAGYKRPVEASSRMLADSKIQQKIQDLGIIGLDTLRDVAKHGKVEMARAAAGKTLVETAYGRPKDNKTTNIGDVTINVLRLEDVPNKLIEQL